MPDPLDVPVARRPPCPLDAVAARHRWCVTAAPWHPTVRAGRARFRRAGCRCGLSVTTIAAWWLLDRPAAEQFVDPDGIQRRFRAAAGTPTVVPR